MIIRPYNGYELRFVAVNDPMITHNNLGGIHDE